MNLEIFINGKPFKAKVYDDTPSLLARYILKEMGPDTLLDYVSIKNPDFVLKKGVKLEILDVRDHMKELTAEDISNRLILAELHNSYSILANYKNILGLWLHVHYPTEKDLRKVVEKLSDNRDLRVRFHIGGPEMFFTYYRNYTAYVKKERNMMEDEFSKWNENIRELALIKPLQIQEFVVRHSTVSISLDLEKEFNILEIFDNFDVSLWVPLIAYQDEERSLFKVFADFDPPKKWLETELTPGIIHFWVLSTIGLENPEYTQGTWNDLHQISFSFATENGQNENQITKILFKAVGNRLGAIQIIRRDETGVGGSFRVKMPGYNKAILAYFISMFHQVSYFLFMDELLETSTNKFVFTFSYKWWTGKTTNVFFTKRERDWVQLTISNSRDRQDIEVMKFIFARIAHIYENNRDIIRNKYLRVLSTNKKVAEKILDEYLPKPTAQIKAKEKRKTRLDLLTGKRPKLFVKGEYSTRCQRSRQPTLLEGGDLLDAYEQRYPGHKALEFPPGSDDYYVCFPGSKRYIYPGLQPNQMTNRRDYPYVPCCYQQSRETKNKHLAKIWNNEEKLYKQLLEDSKGSASAYIAKEKRRLGQDKTGILPSNLAEIAQMAGYNISGKTNSLLRLGVLRSPSSFLHCMERALNAEKYLKLGILKQEEHVKKIREEIAKWEDFSIGKQELFEYTDDEIREILLDDKKYLDPALFYSLISKYYDSNIFLYIQDPQFIDGAVLVPHFSQAYLTKQLDFTKNSVFILVGMVDPLEFQCELLISTGAKMQTKFKGDKLVKVASNIFQNVHEVFTLKPTEKPAEPVKLQAVKDTPFQSDIFQNAESQFIDVDGKLRILNFRKVSVLTSPLPPIDKPVSSSPHSAKRGDLRRFLSKYQIKIIYQEIKNQKAIGVWIDLAKYGIYISYIPLIPTKPLSKVPEAPSNLTNPIATAPLSQSLLLEFKKKRKIASYLKEYTLFEYSIRVGEKEDTKDMFVIDPNHEYDLKDAQNPKRGNTMYRENKIIVPSSKVKKQLEYYLKVQLLNDHSTVLSYRLKDLLNSSYNQIDDFRKVQNQLVFLDLFQILDWIIESHGRNLANVFQPHLQPDLINPYFYRHPYIANNKPVLVQNVEGGLSSAIEVGRQWKRDQTNIGYFAPKEKKGKSKYFIYSEKEVGIHEDNQIPVLIYPDGSYAALLFF